MNNVQLSKYIVTTSFADSKNLLRKILFNTRNGKMLVISEMDWERLANNQTDSLNENTKNILISSGVLVPHDENETAIVLAEDKLASANCNTLYKVIMPSANCQLACTSSEHGNYCGQTHTNQKLDEKMQEEILSRCNSDLSVKQYEALEVAWFGGEPLLAYDIIKKLSIKLRSLAESHRCKYMASMVSNGLILTKDKALQLHHEMALRKIEITLDGIAKYHDKRRCTKGNYSPTFDSIFNNILNIANEPKLDNLKISIRCNVDFRNKEGVYPLIELLKKNNLNKRCSFYVAPVRPWGNDVSNIALDKETFAKFETDVLCTLYKLGFNVSFLPNRKKIACMAVQSRSEVFDAYGFIHNCTETPYVASYNTEKSQLVNINNKNNHIDKNQLKNNQYAIGAVNNNLRFGGEGAELENFYDKIGSGQYQCYDCKMLPTCGGSCPLSWSQGNVPCPPTKFNIENRMLAAYAIYLNSKNSESNRDFNHDKNQECLSLQ